jgi:cell division septation protein DedD
MKRLAGIFLLCVIALFSACGTMDSPESGAEIDLPGEVNRLRDLYREAVRVPITPQIVTQVRKEDREYLLGEIRYFSSVNIALMNNRTGESSLNVETQDLPRIDRPRPVRDSTARQAQDAQGTRTTAQASQGSRNSSPVQGAGESSSVSSAEEAPLSVTFQEIGVLTFREGGSFLNQRRITSDDEGHLKSLSPGGDVFEIHYPNRGLILGFALNQAENWYDLEFAIDETSGERTSLAMTGVRPHLMINYQTVFPAGETRIQMDKTQELSPAVTGENPPPPIPESPFAGYADSGFAPEADDPGESLAGGGWASSEDLRSEDLPFYPGENAGVAEGGAETFILERAPPTQWEDDALEDMFLGEGESPVEVDVVLVMEKPGPPPPDLTAERIRPAGEMLPHPFSNYVIQVGAFRERRNADAAFTALERAGFCPRYETHQDMTRVLIPAVAGRDLVWVREKVKALGFGEPYVRR